MENIFGNRLKSARKMAGLSLRDLSDKIDNYVKHQMIEKYEKGISTPGSDVMIKLANALNISFDYFFKPFDFKLDNIEFRKSANLNTYKFTESVSFKVKSEYEKLYEIENLLNVFETFDNPFQNDIIDINSDFDKYAWQLRNYWNLGIDPVPNIIETLENFNVKVVEVGVEFNKGKFDGLAGIINNQPIIALNKSFDIVRKRFTAVHELAHLLFTFDKQLDAKNIEKFCHNFAGAFLLPLKSIEKLFGSKRNSISLQELIEIKNNFGISVQAIVYRLFSLKIIDKVYYEKFFKYINYNGLKDEKTLGNYQGIEKSSKLKRYVYRALSLGLISMSKAAEILGEDYYSFSKNYQEF